MRGLRWFVPLLLTLVAGAWLMWPQAKVAAPTPSTTTTASEFAPEQADGQAKSESAGQIDTNAPNMASAPALFDLNIRGVPPIAVPRPVDEHLAASEAHALFLRNEDMSDCNQARSVRDDRFFDWESDTGVRWLDDAERQRVLTGLRAAIERLMAACRRQGISTTENEWQGLDQGEYWWALASAAASGDIGARLKLARIRRPSKIGPDANLRALAHEAFANGDADTFGLLAALVGRRPQSFEIAYPVSPPGKDDWRRAPPPTINTGHLWTLVACDLGLACGPSSPTLDRLCLTAGLCSYPSVEEALRDGAISEAAAEATEERRRWMVERVRSGRVDELFVPIPVAAGGN